jgi:hypothetical protein
MICGLALANAALPERCRATSIIPPQNGGSAGQEIHETMRLGWLAQAVFVFCLLSRILIFVFYSPTLQSKLALISTCRIFFDFRYVFQRLRLAFTGLMQVVCGSLQNLGKR